MTTAATKIVKFRLFTGFRLVDDANTPTGKNQLELVFHMGDEVSQDDITPASWQRGLDLDVFYSDEDAEKIRNGTYRGFDAETLYRFRSQQAAPEAAELAANGEGMDISGLDETEVADLILEHKLTVSQTVALAKDGDLESIEKVLDAENIASDNAPRKGVTDVLEAKMQALSQS